MGSVNLWGCKTNSLSNQNIEKLPMQNDKSNFETATFGMGCFWCSEAIFERLKGVESVESGY